MNKKLFDLRKNYTLAELSKNTMPENPCDFFDKWLSDAVNANLLEPNAVVLSTISSDNKVSQRTVLLKQFKDGSFDFFTNYNSRKSKDIFANPNVSLLFLWLELERQVRVEGTAYKLPKSESESYFNLRPRESRISAWASPQSSVIKEKNELAEKYKYFEQKFQGTDVPMPDFWGGFTVKPYQIEFWQGGKSRLHDRFLYILDENNWKLNRLAP